MPTAEAAQAGADEQGQASALTTRASSIARALDEIGDKWCLLIIQEVFWGINSFSAMREATGVSRAVLADRLRWLQQVDCLRRHPFRGSYHLTRKSRDLHGGAMMAIDWERRHYRTPGLDDVGLRHAGCGCSFTPVMRCAHCGGSVDGREVSYARGPGARLDRRDKRLRRRASRSAREVPSPRSVYRNLIDIVGDRWSANIIALAFHGHRRFDDFHRQLPVATNILSERLRFLGERGVFAARAYQQRPQRFEYGLTQKGWDLFPFFLCLLQWGDRWCDPDGSGPPLLLRHSSCGEPLYGVVLCDACGVAVEPHQVTVALD
ncbi:MAG: winged helix-turn-helix transcriptional regulator [Halieaceae bacterium]|nr:winged helix-turn-helix transcriptional regulator [Halieaceae bacterium]